MNIEDVKRAWFGAIRDSADNAGRELKEKAELTPLQAVKLDVLLRQYLCDNLADHIRESENITAEDAEKLQKDIYSDMIEDAIAGIWPETDNMEIAMFLYECTEGVRMECLFSARLKEILSGDDTEEIMQKMMERMNRDMKEFTNQRNARWQPKKKQQRRRSSSVDG